MIKRLSLLPAGLIALFAAGAEATVCDYNKGQLYTGCDVTINIPYCDSYGPGGCKSRSYYTESTPGEDGESDYVVRQEDNTLTIDEYVGAQPRDFTGSVDTGSVDTGTVDTGTVEHEPLLEGRLGSTGFTWGRDVPEGLFDPTDWGVWAADGNGLAVGVAVRFSGPHPLVFWWSLRRHTDFAVDGHSISTEAEPTLSVPQAHEAFSLRWSGDIYARHRFGLYLNAGYYGDVSLSLSLDADGATMDIASTFDLDEMFGDGIDQGPSRRRPSDDIDLDAAYSVTGISVTEEGFSGDGVTGSFYGAVHQIAAGVIESDDGLGVFAATRHGAD